MWCRRISWPRVRSRCSSRKASTTNVCHKGALVRAAMSIRVFVFSCNEFAVALNQTAKQTATMPVAIAKFAQEYEIKHGVMAVGAVLSAIPAIIVLLLAQRHIVKGLTAGAVK